MSEREFWIECIYDAILELGYDIDDYCTEEENLNCTDTLPSEDLQTHNN